MSTYTLTGPASGPLGSISSDFVVSLTSGTELTAGEVVVITPAATGVTGTFSPTTVSLSDTDISGVFTFTPTSATGAATIAVTNNQGLTNPSNLTYTATVMAYTLTPPSPPSGNVDAASANFTVALVGSATLAAAATVTPAAVGGGTFAPTTVSLSNSTRSATFKYTPTVPGAKTISTTSAAALTDPAATTYTCTAQATAAQTVLLNNTGVTLVLSFLRNSPVAAGATFTIDGPLTSLIRTVGGHRITKFYNAMLKLIESEQVIVLSSPDVILLDTVTGAIKELALTSGTLTTVDPSWGAFTD